MISLAFSRSLPFQRSLYLLSIRIFHRISAVSLVFVNFVFLTWRRVFFIPFHVALTIRARLIIKNVI